MPDAVVSSPVAAARRILVVEDEPLIAESLTEIITDMGFECVPAFDVATGLQMATTEVVDAAILNLVIQGGTAYGVAAILASRNIPFAFASGVPHDGLESDWKNRPYIDKPYSEDDIRSLLQQLIPHHNWTTEVATASVNPGEGSP